MNTLIEIVGCSDCATFGVLQILQNPAPVLFYGGRILKEEKTNEWMPASNELDSFKSVIKEAYGKAKADFILYERNVELDKLRSGLREMLEKQYSNIAEFDLEAKNSKNEKRAHYKALAIAARITRNDLKKILGV